MNTSLEIAGVFLFVGGFLYLVLSGRLVDMFRDRAPKPLLFIAAITACAFHHWAAVLSEPVPPLEQAAAAPAAAPAPAAPVTVRHPAKAASLARASDPPPAAPEADHGKMIVFDEYKPKEVFVPMAADPPPEATSTTAPPAAARSGPDPYESKAKRGIKAVGRFLHLRKPER